MRIPEAENVTLAKDVLLIISTTRFWLDVELIDDVPLTTFCIFNGEEYCCVAGVTVDVATCADVEPFAEIIDVNENVSLNVLAEPGLVVNVVKTVPP